MRSCRRFYDCWGRSTKNTIHDGGHAECAIVDGSGSLWVTGNPGFISADEDR